MHITPYLCFNGNCREAFDFYAKAMGGKIEMIMTHKDAPPDAMKGDCAPAPGTENWVMHARMRIGDTVIMASDAPAPHYQKPQGTYLSLAVGSAAEADRIFAALSQGGQVTMPIAETFYAHRFGMAIDRFGTPWMVIFPKEM